MTALRPCPDWNRCGRPNARSFRSRDSRAGQWPALRALRVLVWPITRALILAGVSLLVPACGGNDSSGTDAAARDVSSGDALLTADAGGDAAGADAANAHCAWPKRSCSGECVNVDDVEHCGSCGTSCAVGQTCKATSNLIGNRCLDGCPDSWTMCGDQCIDVMNDGVNCGVCGVRCASDETCDNGNCHRRYGGCSDSGWRVCDGLCVYPDYDRNNCGECGHVCGPQEGCNNGICGDCVVYPTVERCSADQICRLVLEPEDLSCEACVAPLQICDGRCVDVQGDAANCGQCGTGCPAAEACSHGDCMPCGDANAVCCTGSRCGSGLRCERECIGGVKSCTSDPFGGTTCQCDGGTWGDDRCVP